MTEIPNRLVAHAVAESLASLPRYAALPPAGLALLVRAGAPRALRSGEKVIEEGAPGQSIFIVLRGRLKMTRALTNGRAALLGLLGTGDLVGVSGLGGRANNATVTALETSSCLEIPHHRLLAALEAEPTLIADLLPALTEQVAECRGCALEGAFLRVEPRIAKLLSKLAESIGERRRDGVLIPVPLSRQDLADMAGTTVETSIRIMSRWGKEGIVETRSDGFLLQDPVALERICTA